MEPKNSDSTHLSRVEWGSPWGLRVEKSWSKFFVVVLFKILENVFLVYECMSVHRVCASVQGRLEEGIGAGFTDICKLLCGRRELSLGPGRGASVPIH